MGDKWKTTLISKRNRHKQLSTYNVSTNDVENIIGTNLGGDLLLVNKPQTIPWRKKGMPQLGL